MKLATSAWRPCKREIENKREREKKPEWVVLTILVLSSSIISVISLFTNVVTYSLSYSYFWLLFKKGPSQPHLCFCLRTRIWLLYFIRSVSKRKKSLSNYQRSSNIPSGTQLTEKQHFASPCNVNNFDGIENGGGWLGPFKRLLFVSESADQGHPTDRFGNF